MEYEETFRRASTVTHTPTLWLNGGLLVLGLGGGLLFAPTMSDPEGASVVAGIGLLVAFSAIPLNCLLGVVTFPKVEKTTHARVELVPRAIHIYASPKGNTREGARVAILHPGANGRATFDLPEQLPALGGAPRDLVLTARMEGTDTIVRRFTVSRAEFARTLERHRKDIARRLAAEVDTLGRVTRMLLPGYTVGYALMCLAFGSSPEWWEIDSGLAMHRRAFFRGRSILQKMRRSKKLSPVYSLLDSRLTDLGRYLHLSEAVVQSRLTNKRSYLAWYSMEQKLFRVTDTSTCSKLRLEVESLLPEVLTGIGISTELAVDMAYWLFRQFGTDTTGHLHVPGHPNWLSEVESMIEIKLRSTGK